MPTRPGSSRKGPSRCARGWFRALAPCHRTSQDDDRRSKLDEHVSERSPVEYRSVHLERLAELVSSTNRRNLASARQEYARQLSLLQLRPLGLWQHSWWSVSCWGLWRHWLSCCLARRRDGFLAHRKIWP